MSLRHKKQIIKDRSGEGGLTIHYMNRNEFDAMYQQSALDRTQQSTSGALETTIREQKELIATLQKSLEDKTKELKISQASSKEANDHRALCAAQVIQLEKENNKLALDITALVDSHKSEVEALQQEAKAAEKKASDELEESRASYTQMKQGLEQQIHELQQQKKNLRESSWCDITLLNEKVQTLQGEAQVASESIKSLRQSNKKLQQSHTTLGKYIQGQNAEIQAKTNALAESKISYETLQNSFQEQAVEMKAKADAHEQLSLEHKRLQETLQSATEVIEPLKSRICTLEQQYKEQQESSAAKYNTLQKDYNLLQDDNKVKSDEVQSLKTDAVDIKKKIETEMKLLQEKHQSISQHYESQLTTYVDSVANLEREKQAKELVSSCVLFVLNILSQQPHFNLLTNICPTYL